MWTGRGHSGWRAVAASTRSISKRVESRNTFRCTMATRSAFMKIASASFWIGRDSAQCPLAVLDRKLNRLACYSIYEGGHRVTGFNGIYSMLESRDGTMWMATSGAGMLKYDRKSRRLVRYQNHPEDNESLGADSVINLYEDDESNIWVDLHEAAPYYFSEKPASFREFHSPARTVETFSGDVYLRGPQKNTLDRIYGSLEPHRPSPWHQYRPAGRRGERRSAFHYRGPLQAGSWLGRFGRDCSN